MERGAKGAAGIALLAATLGLPLLGAAAAGRVPADLWRFPPPANIPAGYPRFSWTAAILALALPAAVAVSWIAGRRPDRAAGRLRVEAVPSRAFPVWGWAALGWTSAWWFLAWARFRWFAFAQLYTFFPLWLGFIVGVNALVWRRTGSCLMRRSPRRWLTLFAASGAFWWVFEWLNRFADNWHYLGVESFGAAGYAAHATLCFSTVLPAVAAVAEWLASHPRWQAGCAAGPAWPWLAGRPAAWLLLLGGSAALIGMGVWPAACYPALWLGPLALALGHEGLARRAGPGREIAAGDWRRAGTWAVAALVCGFFWEMWNWHSQARWAYTVPWVDRWHVFAMPLLGYAGYMPFGLECLVVVERLTKGLPDDRTTGQQDSWYEPAR